MKQGKKRDFDERSDEAEDGVVLGVGRFAALERLDEEEVAFQREEELNEGRLCDVPKKEAMRCD